MSIITITTISSTIISIIITIIERRGASRTRQEKAGKHPTNTTTKRQDKEKKKGRRQNITRQKKRQEGIFLLFVCLFWFSRWFWLSIDPGIIMFLLSLVFSIVFLLTRQEKAEKHPTNTTTKRQDKEKRKKARDKILVGRKKAGELPPSEFVNVAII